MPLYEYRCADDGAVLTLLRSMAQADEPVADPTGEGRTFTRVQSVFQVDAARKPSGSSSSPPGPSRGCGHGCACHPH